MPWTAWLLAAVVLVCVVALTWRVAVHRTTRGRRRALGAAAHGRSMEAIAPELLAQRGYDIVEVHPQLRYVFNVDGVAHEAFLRADLLVERDGLRYVVEIKTGNAAKPTRRDTRRQLLEYALHYAVDAVLLFDVDRDALIEVDFAVDAADEEDEDAADEALAEGDAPPAVAAARSSSFGPGVIVGLCIAAGIWLILR